MSKKMIVLALAAVSAALFALPAVASAQDIHVEPAPKSFTISGNAGELRASGEPTVTCEKTDGTGAPTSVSGGTLNLEFTGCHINVLGFTVKCRSTGSAADNTINTTGNYTTITWKNAKNEAFPAVLVTASTTTVVCAGTNIYVTGDVIGTIESPACNSENNTKLAVNFTATGTTQDHEVYTGVTYGLKASTNSNHSPEVAAALVGTVTLTATNNFKLNCT